MQFWIIITKVVQAQLIFILLRNLILIGFTFLDSLGRLLLGRLLVGGIIVVFEVWVFNRHLLVQNIIITVLFTLFMLDKFPIGVDEFVLRSL